jgi:hypothetical protein
LGADTNTGKYDIFPNVSADGPHRFFITERGDCDTMKLRIQPIAKSTLFNIKLKS